MQVKEISSKYNIENILSMESVNDFYINQEIDLDYEMVELFRSTQLKVEHFLSRLTTDINSIQYIYYSALSYWYSKFKHENIEAVFSAGIEYGSTFDTVIYDVAKHYKKKVFIMEIALSNGKVIANQLFDYVNKKHLKVNDVINEVGVINIEDFLFNSPVIIPKKKSPSFKELLQQTPERFGGYLAIMFAALLMGKFKSYSNTFSISYWVYLKNYFYAKRILKSYNSLSSKFDKSKKYVYYSLHQEPEASTLARTTLANQLVIIKTISQSLPAGWVLYVKEHPLQFTQLNNFARYYFLASIEKFKTKRYYDEIVKLQNVELLSTSIDSKDIIKHSQAISTINGTVVIEALKSKKPILMFSQGTTPLVNMKDIFDISTSQECKMILDEINTDGKTECEYLDCGDIVQDYLFEVSSPNKLDYKRLVERLVTKE